jgi:hypothetical protein
VESPVPMAVVIPTKMPVPVVGGAGEDPSDDGKAPLVGSTTVSGTPPVPVGPMLSGSDGVTSVGSSCVTVEPTSGTLND